MKTQKKKNYSKYLSTPLKTGIRGFNDLANYYLYCAPNIDCIHSKVKFEQEKAVVRYLFEQMKKTGRLKIYDENLKLLYPGFELSEKDQSQTKKDF